MRIFTSSAMFMQLCVTGIITNLIVAYGDDDGFRTFSNIGGNYHVVKLNPEIKENREEIKRIIRVLNGHIDDRSEKVVEDDVVDRLHNGDDDAEVADQVKQMKRLLALLQKNYDTQIRYSKILEKAQPRIYYIENPEIIDEFKNHLRNKGASTSSSSEVSDLERSSREDDSSNYRREAIFESINLASSENVHPLRNNPVDDRANRFSDQPIEYGTRDRDDYTKILPKGRYKIARDKRSDVAGNNENKRKKSINKSKYSSKKKKQSADKIGAFDEKFDISYIAKGSGPRKQPRETPGGRLNINRDPVKFSDGEQWGGRNKFKAPNEHSVRRPNKRNDIPPSYGRNPKPFGRTFIPFIGKKTIYDEDK